MKKVLKNQGFAWPLVLVGVAVLIIAAGTIAYFLLKPKPLIQSQPTTTPTSELPIQDKQPGGTFSVDPSAEANTKNWKVYSDSKNGFSIKYPSDWFTFPEGIGVGLSDVKDIDPHDDYRYKIVVVNTYAGGETFDLLYKAEPSSFEYEKLPDSQRPFNKRTKVENLTIDGNPAIKFKDEGQSPPADPFLATRFWVKKDGKVFKIQLLQPTKELHDKYKDTFDQMVKTFKFISK